ncbi:hypothetical protein LTR02_003359 [Friedmanniomyces endolithicus]|nr:hypothetical protein LTR38_006394 [Friedmanniomyces endolithicus]KAK0806869.1 hypothetical protein LTR59_003545 [Friedmanniomyces endolithicus]KAK0856643.1 hypothetical protein LTS02_010547 [Friedmanniomyces endolithicus]KAK0857028.1 hypothetical protein LTR03_000949 [Friedmanniomyces endolithicus]KAK0882470.1 hypothetical protein LTR87_003765 [Friedmanniomyces endolithicus]
MPEIIDDKSEHCVPFIIERIKQHRRQYEDRGEKPPPFFVGLNGVQGAGKTTLVTTLSKTLASPPHSLPIVVLSIDDLYLPHSEQEALARSHSDNPLVQHRGQPSTHDIDLGVRLFDALAKSEANIRLPSYDKSAYSGSGDRRPETEWETVNAEGKPPVEVVVFEGWCVGFRPLDDKEVERKWRAAQAEYESKDAEYQGQLGKLQLLSVLFVNAKLREYDALTDRFGAFMHIDAEDTQYVYDWRLEQEAALRAAKGTGMTGEQVVRFVNGCESSQHMEHLRFIVLRIGHGLHADGSFADYPAYELYTDQLRNGIFGDEKDKQLRLVVGRDRKVKEVVKI